MDLFVPKSQMLPAEFASNPNVRISNEPLNIAILTSIDLKENEYKYNFTFLYQTENANAHAPFVNGFGPSANE